MSSKKNIVPEVGARLLVHAPQISVKIFEGIIREVSANGKLFHFGGDWMTTEAGGDARDALYVEILDELPPKPIKEGVSEMESPLEESPGSKKILFLENTRVEMDGSSRTFKAGEVFEFEDISLIQEILEERAGRLV